MVVVGVVRDAPSVPRPVAALTAARAAGDGVKHTFKAETRKILDIMANSLYTDKEVDVLGTLRGPALCAREKGGEGDGEST